MIVWLLLGVFLFYVIFEGRKSKTLRGKLYKVGRILGDVNAVKKGRVARRVVRRGIGKQLGQWLGKLLP